MNSFNVGDVVMLKSGGLKMTIDRITGETSNRNPIYRCKWFVNGGVQTEDFHTACLIFATSLPEVQSQNPHGAFAGRQETNENTEQA